MISRLCFHIVFLNFPDQNNLCVTISISIGSKYGPKIARICSCSGERWQTDTMGYPFSGWKWFGYAADYNQGTFLFIRLKCTEFNYTFSCPAKWLKSSNHTDNILLRILQWEISNQPLTQTFSAAIIYSKYKQRR